MASPNRRRALERRFARAYLDGVALIRRRVDKIPGNQITTDAGLKRLDEIIDAVPVIKSAESDALEPVIFAAARDAFDEFPAARLPEPRLRSPLTLKFPLVAEAAQRQAADLVTNVTPQTKAAIREIIVEAVRDGIPVADFKSEGVIREGTASKIKSQVGLTNRDRKIADKIQDKSGKAVADKWRVKALKRRANNIARTEIIKAETRGKRAAWNQMARDGLIDTRRQVMRWVVTRDDRLCPRCAPMEGKKVSLSSDFTETERGLLPSKRVPVVGVTVEGPPLHPSCRCKLVADFLD